MARRVMFCLATQSSDGKSIIPKADLNSFNRLLKNASICVVLMFGRVLASVVRFVHEDFPPLRLVFA